MFREFLWGVSISGFQFEMGDPEGLSVDPNSDWFVWVHDEANVSSGVVSGDLPEDGPNYWFLFAEDHRLAQDMGMNAFRIGIEWSRLFPKPTRGVRVDYELDSRGLIAHVDIGEEHLLELDRLANKSAIRRYREIVRDLRDRGFKVIVNLNHFTLPIWIHDPIKARDTRLKRGPLGWLDRESVVEFAKYAAYVAWKLGDLVDVWSVFNEPNIVAIKGYLVPSGFPPGVADHNAYIRANVNMAVAHARAFDAIKKFDRVRADSESPSAAVVGLIHNITPAYPLDPGNARDVVAARNFSYVYNEWFLNAVVNGELDEDLDGETGPQSRVHHLRGKVDWIGVNYYTRCVLRAAESKRPPSLLASFEIVEGYGRLCEPRSRSRAGLPTSDFGWEVYPKGLYDSIEICLKYGKPILVTENGVADEGDVLRPSFIVEHVRVLEEVRKAFNVAGYLHWSLIDNYEWAHGFRMKFGLFGVDFRSKKRIPRRSAFVFKEIAENNGVTESLLAKYSHL